MITYFPLVPFYRIVSITRLRHLKWIDDQIKWLRAYIIHQIIRSDLLPKMLIAGPIRLFNVYEMFDIFFLKFGFCARIVLHIRSECEINVSMPLKCDSSVSSSSSFSMCSFPRSFSHKSNPPKKEVTFIYRRLSSPLSFLFRTYLVTSHCQIDSINEWMDGWNGLKWCVLHIPMKSMVFTIFEWCRNNEAIQFESNARANSLNSCVLFI